MGRIRATWGRIKPLLTAWSVLRFVTDWLGGKYAVMLSTAFSAFSFVGAFVYAQPIPAFFIGLAGSSLSLALARYIFYRPRPAGKENIAPIVIGNENVFIFPAVDNQTLDRYLHYRRRHDNPPQEAPNQPIVLGRARNAQTICPGQFHTIRFVNILDDPEFFFDWSGETLYFDRSGKYEFDIVLNFSHWDRNADIYECICTTSNRNFRRTLQAKEMPAAVPIRMLIVAEIDAGDTAYCGIMQFSGEAITTINNDSYWKVFRITEQPWQQENI